MIIDATFICRSARTAARQCAGGLGVPFFILRFGANAAVLRERLRQRAARASDASEADETVLAAQERALEPLLPDELSQAVDVQPLPGASGSGAMPQADWRPLLSRLAAGQPRPDKARQGTQRPLASDTGEPLSRMP